MDAERSRSFSSDRILDSMITNYIAQHDKALVVDAWLQPWLCNSRHALRLWLESDFDSRVKKATVTYLRSRLPLPESVALEVDCIGEATILSSDDGINTFQPKLQEALMNHLSIGS
jgi:hypothetical protein